MARGRPYRFQRFARGLNTADAPYGLQEGYRDDPTARGSECRSCLNVISRSRGNIARRNGSSAYGSSLSLGTQVRALSAEAIGQDTLSFLIANFSDGTLRSQNASGTWTTLRTSQSVSARWSWIRDDDGRAYGMNGINTPCATYSTAAGTWKLTSDTVTGASSVNGRFLTQAGNRGWIAGDPTRPYSVFQTDISDPSTLTAEIRFNPGSTYPITGLGTSGPYVLVFTERDIYVIYDTETGANRKLTTGCGTLCHHSIVETEGGTFFLDSRRGVMICDGNSQPRAIGEQLRPTWDLIAQSDHPRASGAWFDRHYYLAAPVAGTMCILDYDAELDSWWVHSPKPDALAVWDYGPGSQLVGLVGTSTVKTWRLFVPGVDTDPDGTFASYWSSPFHTFGDGYLRKRGREVHFDGRGQVDVFIAADYAAGNGIKDSDWTFDFTSGDGTFGGTGTFGGAGTFGGTVVIGEDSLYSFGVARSWSLTFLGVGSSRWEIDAYTMLMTTRTE